MKEAEKKQSERRPDSYYPPLMGTGLSEEENMQQLNAQLSIEIPPDKVLIDKVELQELQEKASDDGWMSMTEFRKLVGKSFVTVTKVLNRPEVIRRLSIDYGGWIWYPCSEDNRWSFRRKEALEFINNEFYPLLKNKNR